MNKWLHVILLFARYSSWTVNRVNTVNIVNEIFMVIENSLKTGIDYLEAGAAMKSSFGSLRSTYSSLFISSSLKLAYWHPRFLFVLPPNELCDVIKHIVFSCPCLLSMWMFRFVSFRFAGKRGWNNWKS